MYSVAVEVLDFQNYRDFLRLAVEELKKTSEFSYRKFSKSAGFQSPNFLLLLIQGERNLSLEGSLKIAKALGLKEVRQGYFKDLVCFNQSHSAEERFYYSQNLLKYKSKLSTHLLENDQAEYLKDWAHVVIRELLLFEPLLTEEQIAKKILPTVKIEVVRRSLSLMQKMGFISLLVDEQGMKKWNVNQISISTGNQFVHSAAFNYHRQMIQLAHESLARFSREERFISGSTLGLSKENFEKVKSKITELREEILALSELDNNKHEVYQINFQIFPLTQSK